jgi:hypothetical protein
MAEMKWSDLVSGGSSELTEIQPQINRLFLVCGAMKAGTTWLFSVLRQHPLIASTPIKEIHFFAPKSIPWEPLCDANRIETIARYFANHGPFAKEKSSDVGVAQSDMNWFKVFLRNPVNLIWFNELFGKGSTDRWFSDFSPFTSLGNARDLQYIQQSTRSRRLLYVLRHPLERYWSHYNFHKSLYAPEEDVTVHNEQQYYDDLQGIDFYNHGQYGRFISEARSIFDDHEFMVIFIEECRIDPLRVVRKIENFLGIPSVDYDPISLYASIFPSRTLSIPDAFRRACRPLAMRDCDIMDDAGVRYPAAYRT